jgi:hypothetical protein
MVRKFRYSLGILALVLAFCGSTVAQSVAPIGGVGSIQFLSNTGVPLTNGVLYVFQAGTTTQAVSYTDYTGTVQNPNPVPFSTGGRATIWLSVGAYFKLVLCLQNDGPVCAPSDVLFSIDQVPGGGTSGSGGGGGSFTGTFISGTSPPATTGALRLASSDSICWRNQSGTTNLCFSKNSNDLLTWVGGSLIFPEVSSIAGSCVTAGFDCVWADSSAHRWMMSNNGGTPAQMVASGVDINTSDQVTQVHFGATAIPFSSTPPSTIGGLTYLKYNGSQIVGATAPPQTYNNHALFLTGTPTVSLCGTGAAVGGTDNAFTVNGGSGSVSSCQVNFGTAFTTTPVCVLTGFFGNSVTLTGVTTAHVSMNFATPGAGVPVQGFCF